MRSSTRSAALGMALLASLAPGAAEAQFSLDPFPGTAPVKSVAGTDLRWDGAAWVTPPGSTIEWTISIVNDGWSPAVTVDIVDDIPDPADGDPLEPFDLATDVVQAPASGDLTYSGDWLQLTGSLALFGEGFDLSWVSRVRADAPNGAEICNRASVTYTEATEEGGPVNGLPRRWRNWTENENGEVAATCVRVSAGQPLLSESWKEASDADGDGLVAQGEEVTFTITVRNTGDADARNVVVTDDVAPPFTLVSAGEGGVVTGASVRWEGATTPALDRLSPGETTVLTLVARLDGCPTTPACNQALLSSDEILEPVGSDDPTDAEPGSATCVETIAPVLAGSPLRVSDADGDGAFLAGEGVSYEFLLTNSGAAPARDVSVRLPLPLEIVSATAGQGGVVTASEAAWDSATTPELADIAPGAVVRLTVDGFIDAVAAIGAAACARGFAAPAGCPEEGSDDPVPTGGDDETCFTVAAPPELALTITATDVSGDDALELGEMVEYELVATVLSGAPAAGLSVELVLPPGELLDAVEADDGGLVSADRVNWNATTTPALDGLATGESVTLLARGTLSCRAGDAASACGDGSVDATNAASPVGADAPACLTAAVPDLTGFELVATDASGDGLFEGGEAVTLSLGVENVGSASADDVVVTLPLEPALGDVVASDGGVVLADRVEWSAATTPALTSLAAGASLSLSVTASVDPASVGTRSCHEASATWSGNEGCSPAGSDDPGAPGAADPTCFDVTGESLPPVEVPDGDPGSAGGEPVRLGCVGDDLRIAWDATLRAETYLVHRGALGSFDTRPWTNPAAPIDDPENATPSCDVPGLEYLDEAECATGREDVYYLVTARNAVGDGPVGEESIDGVLSPRVPVAMPCP